MRERYGVSLRDQVGYQQPIARAVQGSQNRPFGVEGGEYRAKFRGPRENIGPLAGVGGAGSRGFINNPDG